ncbi:MAG: type II toxin-antitoxin system RelE/ParE family toxin [Candidatus Omnitrophota bacterium]
MVFTPAAEKQFRKIPFHEQLRLKPHIDALAENPRPSGVKKLKAEVDRYRIHVGDCRIIYRIFDDILLITVVKIAHRREAY